MKTSLLKPRMKQITSRIDQYSIFMILLFATAMGACGQTTNSTERHGKANMLINETSPYLLQHAYNPVNWNPWNEVGLKQAQDEDKLMIISIGYSACHWCHVMEKESFTDSIVAKIMNENYVSIKIDREERPDIDQIYMNAAMLINGNTGWPLNIVALPDGRPVFAGTYLPKDNWIRVLEFFTDAYQNDKEKLLQQADQVTKGIQLLDLVEFNNTKTEFSSDKYSEFYQGMVSNIDLVKGGSKRAPKFPSPYVYEAFLEIHYFESHDNAKKAVEVTLDEMAKGGIYDQIGGGFARYSTDANWRVPHFEKMLYDNAQLLSLYSHAYQVFGKPAYKNIVYETFDFLKREMRSPDGAFFSSLDADSDGEEGKFYVWTSEELYLVLGEEGKDFGSAFNVSNPGNWEDGKNILYRRELPQSGESQTLISAKRKLLDHRSKRVLPPRDDKVLTSLNALTIKGLCDAYAAFGDELFLESARQAADLIVKRQMRSDGGLYRNFMDGKSMINGFLDDYGYTIEAFIRLYEVTLDEQWLESSMKLMVYAIGHFQDPVSKMFYYSSDEDEALIARKMELSDNVTPSSNASIATGLFMLGNYYYKPEFIELATQMLTNMLDETSRNPYYYAKWVSLYGKMAHPFYEVAIVGKEASEKSTNFLKVFSPNTMLLGGETEGSLELLANKLVDDRTMIYVCQNKSCKLPVEEVSKALNMVAIN